MSSRQPDPSGLHVDIVINNYNYGRFLADAIETALAQTHPRVEVIVVDDGSIDDSRTILRSYEKDIEIILKENGGQASALNVGFSRCAGDIVIFLDADDMLRPEAAAVAAAAFAADPRIVKVQYRMELVDADGQPTGIVKPPAHVPLPVGDVRRSELTFPFDLVWLSTSGNAFAAQPLRRIFPIPERGYPICADFYLVHLTALLGPVVSVDEVAGLYRVHGDNLYEVQEPRLDLVRVRQTVTYAATTRRELERLADELGLEHRTGPILSVSDLANRLVSVKLEPYLHPLPSECVSRLVLDGARAAVRRFDVSWQMKLLFAAWFVLVALTPRPLVRPLAELFLFPARRKRMNRLLGRFHRGNEAAVGQAQRGPSHSASPTE